MHKVLRQHNDDMYMSRSLNGEGGGIADYYQVAARWATTGSGWD